MTRPLLAAFVLLHGCFCGGSRGKLVDAGTDVAFVSERGAVVASTATGIVAIALDGSRTRTLFAERRTILDISGDYRTWVAEDSDTNLFLGDLETGSWRRVPELDGIVSDAAISPDGTKVIVSRHGDFSKRPTIDEDTLYLVDVASLAVEVLPKTTDDNPTNLFWSEDGKSVLGSMGFQEAAQWIDVATNTRTAPPDPRPPLYATPARLTATCKEEIRFGDWSTQIDVQDAAGNIVTVVREEGRERGFHDHDSDFGQPELTPGCGYVLFRWERGAWLADAKGSGQNGPLVPEGEVLFFADPALLGPE